MKINKAIILIHDTHFIKEIKCIHHQESLIQFIDKPIVNSFFQIASEHPEMYIGWCNELHQQFVNFEDWVQLMEHPYQLLSYTSGENFIEKGIGYVEFNSPFVIPNSFGKKFGTWLVSSESGIAHSQIISQFSAYKKITTHFDLLLSALVKQASKQGVFIYSEPRLLNKSQKAEITTTSSTKDTLKLITSFNGMRWAIYFVICKLLFEKKFNPIWLVIPFTTKLFKPIKLKHQLVRLDTIQLDKDKNNIEVIIPTLGRPKYLRDVLIDLSSQTMLPSVVTIIEQKNESNALSDLQFLKDHNFPFKIKHTLINQLGACNARNYALNNIDDVEWIFFADDDIRLENDTLQNAIQVGLDYKLNAITMAVNQKSEKIKRLNYPKPWSTFGSGCSIVKKNFATSIRFDMNLEFGYGEDADYGMSLRKAGCDVAYLSTNPILHLKAPMGGFRTKFVPQWGKEPIQPKPSPTIMYNHIKNQTLQQLQGYKFFLITSQVLRKKSLNIKKFLFQWNLSFRYANQLKEDTKQTIN